MADSAIAVLRIEGPNLTRDVEVSLGSTTIGRQSSNEVHLPSPMISRQHARIHCDESGCLLEDLGSSNGTILNGDLLEAQVRVLLKDSDLIEVGPFQMRFELVVAGEAEAYAEAQAGSESEAAEAVEAAEEVETQEPSPAEEPVIAAAPEVSATEEEPAVDEAPVEAAPPVTKSSPKVEQPSPTPTPEKPEATARPARKTPAEKSKPAREKPPADKPPTPPPVASNGFGDADGLPPIPPGLDRYSRRYLDFLPPIYHSDFMSRFLALFEAVLMPVEWTVDGFDMFLDPKTAPSGFLPWLQNWFLMTFDDTWSDAQRRVFLQEAHLIYARRGTKWALQRILEIYLGKMPEIDDDSPQLEPLTFLIRIPFPEASLDRQLVENLIDLNKPAHTTYQLTFSR